MKKFLSIALVLVMLVALCGCDATDYKKAMKAYDDGDYAEARDMFEALDDYKDSADLMKDCDYRLAKKAMDKEDYDKALSMLEKLGDYKESEELAQECNYKLALEQMEKGKYAEATELLEKAGSYKGAEEQLNECSYQLALADIAAGDLETAQEKLTALEGYKDSAELLNSLAADLALMQLVGSWTAEYDITELFADVVVNIEGGLVRDYLDLPTLMLEFDLEVASDYSWELALNPGSVDRAMDDILVPLTDSLVAYMRDYFPEILAESGITLQDAYDTFGVSNIDDLIDASLGMPVRDFIASFYTEDVLRIDANDYIWSGEVYADGDQIGVNSWDYSIKSMSYDAASGKLTAEFYYNDLNISALTFTRK